MPKVCVLQINVTDMDQAIDFYCNKIGFEVLSREHYPQIIKLKNDSAPLLLFKVSKKTDIDYPNEAQTLINIETGNLKKSLRELREKGVDVIQDTPETCPVGIYAGVRDPFGNVFELIEYTK
jgi:predicted enzyme related to lactoylglutathione lyase